jgi:hypothetical protein
LQAAPRPVQPHALFDNTKGNTRASLIFLGVFARRKYGRAGLEIAPFARTRDPIWDKKTNGLPAPEK